MSRGLDLYRRYSAEELSAMMLAVRSDPTNKNPIAGTIHLFTPKARKKMEDIAWAIRYHLEDKKEQAA